MSAGSRAARTDAPQPGRPATDPVVKAASSWIHQLARTLKTCRLYDASNPTVVRFRDDLSSALERMVVEFGPVTYRFVSDDVLFEDHSLYPARSRDDNLAFAFFRDGVRRVTFGTGVDSRELNVLVDSLLAVTGSNLDGDDLVTLLWEANLRSIEVDYVPAEGDVGGGPVAAGETGPLLPWPTAAATEEMAAPASPDAGADDTTGRSEDWQLGERVVEVEASFAELDFLSVQESERFRAEFYAEHGVHPVVAAIAIGDACLRANATDADRADFVPFLARALRSAVAVGAWSDARVALELLRGLAMHGWTEETFVQELLQPISIVHVAERVDQQELPLLEDFIALALDFGEPAVDWLVLVLAESQQQPVRQRLAEFLAQHCRTRPDRLGPWLADHRWFLVRNIVFVLGWIGGPAIVPLLQPVLRHEEPRVREAAVKALGNADLRLTRPLLVRALDHADANLFGQVLALLSRAKDAPTARFVFGLMKQERFASRSPEERRAVYAAVANIGGDEIVGELEAELTAGLWFQPTPDPHQLSVARCLARIATPRALDVLARGVASKRPAVRRACEEALLATRQPREEAS
jgi:hypothetical protein